MKISNIVNFFWEGEFTSMQLASILSYKKHGFQPVLWRISQDLNLDEYDIEVKDSTTLFPFNPNKRYLDWRDGDLSSEFYNTVVPYSAMLRLELNKRFPDQMYSDCDVLCLKDYETWQEYLEPYDNTLSQCAEHYNGNTIYLCNNELFNKVFGTMVTTLYRSTDHIKFGALGVATITFIANHVVDLKTPPPHYFYPIWHDHWKLCFSNDEEDIATVASHSESSLCIHWWNNATRYYGVDVGDDRSFVGSKINAILAEYNVTI